MSDEEIIVPPEGVPVPVPPAPEPTAEQLRDEKCIPVVRMILNDFAVSGLPIDAKSRGDFQTLVMGVLQRALDADLNLTTENPYIFQLITQVFSGLNTTVAECEKAEVDDARYGEIIKKILGFLAVSNVVIGKDPALEESRTSFAPIKEQINALFAQEKLTWLEVKYIMESVFNSLKAVQQIYSQNVDMALERMEAKILGVDVMSDLGMKKLNDVLVTPSSGDVSRETVV